MTRSCTKPPTAKGAKLIIDTRLPISRGIAGYVARTCQALIIEQVAGDPRFARDIAERVGYVPDSILATPIVDERGDVMGVLSVLDRGRHTGDTLAIASAFADQASFLLPHIDLTVRLAPVLFASLADAIEQSDHDLAGALRRQAARLPDDTLELAAVLTELRSLNPAARVVGRATARRVHELRGDGPPAPMSDIVPAWAEPFFGQGPGPAPA